MILYTLDTKYFKKQSIVYCIISLFVFIFGFIYEKFGHGVHSVYMNKAYLIPFIFGFIISLIIYIFKFNKFFKRISVNLYNAFISTITLYSIVRGVLEIYGTTNNLINIYLYLSLGLFVLCILFNFIKINFK